MFQFITTRVLFTGRKTNAYEEPFPMCGKHKGNASIRRNII